MAPDLYWETQSGYPRALVAGIDEVGRGCLAGPVVAAAVILPAKVDFARDAWALKIADSKKLSPEVRAELAPLIEKWAYRSAIGVASVEEIDRLNIHHACHLAMMRALKALEGVQEKSLKILVDGKFVPKGLRDRATAIVKGDDKCLSIAAASIVAKVWRDRHMEQLDYKYPGYGLAVHKGYSTPAHKAALEKLGPAEIHRRSFEPVAKFFGKSEDRETEPEFSF